jgi:2-phospho-L-lactate guanylyltransferase
MRVVVPFAAEAPKTRLRDELTPTDRDDFSRAMLEDVVATLRAAGREPEILATAPIDSDAAVTVDDRPLTEAVNAVLADASDADDDGEAVAVVMADLALATPAAVERLLTATGDVVLAPGRGGGTNALVARHPDFRVDYHGASYRDHVDAAAAVGATVTTVDSFRLAVDVDEPGDLVEVLLHGEGLAAEWLRDAGFELAVTDGRVGLDRRE